MTRLTLLLPRTLPTAATLCQAVLSEDGRTPARAIESTLALLPAPAGQDTVVIVPAARLSWHRLELPKGALKASAARLRSVLDGLLE